MNAKTKKILRYLLSVLLAVVLLYFSFRKTSWSDFKHVLTGCRWMFVGLAMLAGALSSAVRALRWRLLLHSADADRGWWRSFNAVNIGKLADLAFPHVGELVRCGYIVSPSIPYNRVLGTVVLERSWDIVTLVALIAGLLATGWSRFGEFFATRIWEPLSGRISARLLVVLVVAVLALVVAIILSRGVRKFAKGLWEGFATCIKMKGKGWFLLLTVVLWVCFYLMCLFVVKAIPQVGGFESQDVLFIMLVGCLAGIVPVPGGFGAFHYLIALALSTLYGMPFEMGIIFATLSHESQAVTTIIFGLGSYVFETLRKRDEPR